MESRVVGAAIVWTSAGSGDGVVPSPRCDGTTGAAAGMIGTAVPGGSNIGSGGRMAGLVGRPRPSGGGVASAPAWGEGGGGNGHEMPADIDKAVKGQ